MKALPNKKRGIANEIRSFADFKKLFYPNPEIEENCKFPNPEQLGKRIAKESLTKLQAALAVS